MENIRAALIKLYVRNGAVIEKEQGEAIAELLHIRCLGRDICWQGCDTNKECDWNKIQLPYIGNSYLTNPKRLVVLGINLNKYGGLDALETLISEVPKELRLGKKKIDFRALGSPPEYPGSIFWHRVAVYSFLLLNNDWELNNEKSEITHKGVSLLNSFGERAQVMGQILSQVFENIAFLERIKCSPNWDKSRPTAGMWGNCPERFLKLELEILAPDNILILGGNPIYALDEPDVESENRRIKIFHTSIADKQVAIYNIIHPTAPGGASKSVALDLGSILKNQITIE